MNELLYFNAIDTYFIDYWYFFSIQKDITTNEWGEDVFTFVKNMKKKLRWKDQDLESLDPLASSCYKFHEYY